MPVDTLANTDAGKASVSVATSIRKPLESYNVDQISAVRPNSLGISTEFSLRGRVNDTLPDFSREFWTPIHIHFGGEDPYITLCRLNFNKYSNAPHETPMFKDMEAVSLCTSRGKVRKDRLSVLTAQLREDIAAGRTVSIPPTGFVFHEGRVGSTLVANLLGSSPHSMVYAESDPPVDILRNCRGCSRQEKIRLLREVVALMGSSPVHKYLFFKMQSISTMQMDIVLEAFPQTAWAFVYREPVQTMMSQVDPAKGGGGGPCLRSRRDRPKEITEVLARVGGPEASANSAGWCAGHLNMLCNSAIASFEYAGMFKGGRQRGMLVNYESLPGAVPRALLPMFGVETVSSDWLSRMAVESKSYSKSRPTKRKGSSSDHSFSGDSIDKEARSTQDIRKYAKLVLMPTFEKQARLSQHALQNVMTPSDYKAISSDDDAGSVNWRKLSTIPAP